MSGRDLIPVAVVGAGNMGTNHIRVYDELPEAELVGVVEANPNRAQEIVNEYRVPVVDRVADLDEACAATVAVPNRLHQEVTETCIDQGMDVLVEKPLATTVEEAEAIVNAASEAGVLLQVGHIERFNPAVEVLGEILKNEKLIALETHRLGPFNEHLSDESVVFDLMIHDIDIIESIVDSQVAYIDAIGANSRSEKLDHVTANLKFENGVVGTATASQVTHGKIRNLTATAQNAYIELDYQDQNVVVHRRGLGQQTTVEGRAGYRTETVSEIPFVPTREPLKNEIEHFLSRVRDREVPRVSGIDGVESVKRAFEIIEQARQTSG
jgi:predicted dehydrogenase